MIEHRLELAVLFQGACGMFQIRHLLFEPVQLGLFFEQRLESPQAFLPKGMVAFELGFLG